MIPAWELYRPAPQAWQALGAARRLGFGKPFEGPHNGLWDWENLSFCEDCERHWTLLHAKGEPTIVSIKAVLKSPFLHHNALLKVFQQNSCFVSDKWHEKNIESLMTRAALWWMIGNPWLILFECYSWRVISVIRLHLRLGWFRIAW